MISLVTICHSTKLVSQYRCLLLWTVTSELFSLYPTGFGMLCFHFIGLSEVMTYFFLFFCCKNAIDFSDNPIVGLKILFYFLFHFSFGPQESVVECPCIHEFLCFLPVLMSSFITVCSEKILGVISVFLNLPRLCGLTYGLSWKIFHGRLRRMCILLLLDIMYMSIRSVWSSVLQICFIDSLSGWPIIECGVIKSPTVVVLFISPFSA